MVNKYDEFLLESLLLESVVGFSEKFRKVLSKVDSPISNLLLNVENRDLEINMTLIDVSEVDGMLNFSPENKAPQVIKIGRLIRTLLLASGQEVSDKDIEVFTYAYREAIFDKDGSELFDIVKGEDICEYYRGSRTENNGMGNLNSSCMRNAYRSTLELYIYSDNIEMLILRSGKDNTKIVGRAILWTLTSGDKFLDDIYFNSDNVKNLFIEYADKNGIKRLGNIDGIDIVAQVKKGLFEYFPYLDTLTYYNTTTGIISMIYSSAGDGIILSLCSTDGVAEDIFCSGCRGKGNTYKCVICDGKIDSIVDDYFEEYG